MVTDATETDTFTSRTCGHGVAAGTEARGLRKCRTWSRLRHTGQSDASWTGTRRACALSRGAVSSRADTRAAGGSGPRYQPGPDAVPSNTGVTPPGHEPPHQGLVRVARTICAPSAACQ